MKLIKPLILLFVCALSFSLNAKADGNGHAYGHDKDKHGNAYRQNKQKEGKKVPIDGGISLLVIAGAAIGAKRVYQKNQKNTPGDQQ